MITIGDALAGMLITTPSITAIVGNRVKPQKNPEKPVYPSIVYHKISGSPEYSMDGESGLTQCRVQLDLYAPTYKACKDLAGAVQLALSGFAGTMGDPTQGTVPVGAAFLLDEDDGYNDSLEVFWWRQDYEIWHNG